MVARSCPLAVPEKKGRPVSRPFQRVLPQIRRLRLDLRTKVMVCRDVDSRPDTFVYAGFQIGSAGTIAAAIRFFICCAPLKGQFHVTHVT